MIAGNGIQGFSGDNGRASSASLNTPTGVTLSHDGGVYIADINNYRVRRVDAEGVIRTVAGNGRRAFGGDGGPATEASIGRPIGVAVDRDGNLFIAFGPRDSFSPA
ncbi:MAG: hypothetical protein ACRD44_11605 [Bryobacteraceae bacterium]